MLSKLFSRVLIVSRLRLELKKLSHVKCKGQFFKHKNFATKIRKI